MKTNYLKMTTVLVAIAALTVSCDGCKDKKAAGPAADEVNVTTEPSAESQAYENTSQGDASGAGNPASKKGSSGSGSTGTKKGNNGYSAADGTDAENHDGDMYTKHDTTQRPSGPPIK